MLFSFSLGLKTIPTNAQVTERAAVRAVLWYKGRLIMVKTAQGDYKFPGGGINAQEDTKFALLREISEETGYCHVVIGELLGSVVQQQLDINRPDQYFRMVSHYYSCELVDEENAGQKLDDYEHDLGFKACIVAPEAALRANDELLRNSLPNMNVWVKRETEVLKMIVNT